MALTMNDIYEILKNEGGRTPSEKVMEVSKDYPEKIAMRYKVFGIWQETTYKDFWLKSNYVSMALRFFGVEKGESVAIQSENRPEWLIADIAIMNAGGVTVPLFTTYSDKDYEYIINDCKPKICIVSNNLQFKKIEKFIFFFKIY